MTAKDFQDSIQNEITSNSFPHKLSGVKDDKEFRTVLEFNQPVTTELHRWLNTRFMYGVTMYDLFTIKLNHPNECQK